MEQSDNNYLKPGSMFIIVKALTQKIVEEAINSYAEQYWLEFFAVDIEESGLDDEADDSKDFQ